MSRKQAAIIENFMEALDVDRDVAEVLVEEGFTSLGRGGLCAT